MATLSVNPKNELTLKDHVKARAASMIARQNDEKQAWYDIATLSGYPPPQSLISTGRNSKRPKSRIIYDGHATRAFRYLEAGMYSGLASPNRPWFKLKLADDEAMENHDVRVWLEECEAVVYAMLAASNFYRAVRANFRELGRFGVAAALMDEDWRKGVSCTALPIGDYAIATNAQGEVDTLLWVYQMDTRQLVQSFVAQPGGAMDWSNVHASVKEAWSSSNYQACFQVHRLIEPNAEYRDGAWGAAGMAWRSVKWMMADDDKSRVLEHKGYHEKPFWAPRWTTYGVDVWPTGPGHDALPDMRELQMQAKRKGEVTDLVVRPPTQGPPLDVRLRPGSHISVANMDAGKVEAIYTAPYQAIQLVGSDLDRCQRAIDEATYAGLFMAITDREGVQPLNDLETQLRNDEKMTQLGPVIEAVNTDMLATAVDRAFGIAARGDLLPEAPDGLGGASIDIEFISVLAQAQKMAGMGQTERSLAFIGAVAQFQPDVVDMVDGDALIEDHWQRSAAPAVGLRDKKSVDDIRATRAQQQKMAQMAQMAAPAKQGVEAAALLNEIGQQRQ